MKATKEGWPDPIDWVNRLRAKLQEEETAYRWFLACERGETEAQQARELLEDDEEPIDKARVHAASSLAAVLLALKELPAFKRFEGFAPLHGLVDGLVSLDRGARVPIFETRKGIKRGQPFGDEYLQTTIVWLVKMLEAAGLNNNAARQRVAEILRDYGFTGRKKVDGRQQGLSAQTLWQWQTAIEGERETGSRRKQLLQVKQRYETSPEWPPTIAQAEAEIRRVAGDALLQTKI